MIRETASGITLAVHAQPGAKKTRITGVYGCGANAQLKVAVHAPPLKGLANESPIAFLAGFFSISRNNVEIVAGEMSRRKVILLRGVTLGKVRSLLGELEPPVWNG